MRAYVIAVVDSILVYLLVYTWNVAVISILLEILRIWTGWLFFHLRDLTWLRVIYPCQKRLSITPLWICMRLERKLPCEWQQCRHFNGLLQEIVKFDPSEWVSHVYCGFIVIVERYFDSFHHPRFSKLVFDRDRCINGLWHLYILGFCRAFSHQFL